jgi:alkaline phosphatase D
MVKYVLPLLFTFILVNQTLAQSFSANRSNVNPLAAPFFHGVASGDPTSESVLLWTRITSEEESPEVFWEIATDTLLNNIVASGDTLTGMESDFTVKVVVANLEANRWYYYRFSSGGMQSPIGRTRTAPESGIENLRFAVMSCSNYQDGYFNAYRDVVNKNDVDAIIHLGDYIYEYGISDFSPGTDTSRLHDPENEIISLEEYRLRHSQYKLDVDLQEIHRQFPFIAVWDDHETANNSWVGGAQNHTEGAEGDWQLRKNNGKQAFFEWMPVNNNNDLIRRSFSWGNLAEIIMIDTRLEGRDEQLGTSGPVVSDTNRTLLGLQQREWLKSELSESTSQWKLIGNQVMIAPLRIFGNPVNEDQWDGYPAERERVLSHIQNNGINNCVFLTGDIHTSWGNDVPLNPGNYNASTGAGSTAVEFVCTSISSSSFLTFSVPLALIQTFNPYIKYAELSKRGYLLLDINQQQIQGDWIHMSTVESRNFQSQTAASRRSLNNENHLETASQPLQARNTNPPLAPQPNYLTTALSENQNDFLIVSCMPNPFSNKIAFQFYLLKPSEKITISLQSISGSVVYLKEINKPQEGLHEGILQFDTLPNGMYILSINDGQRISSRKVIKN